jgi:hypothetical protein
MRMECRENNGGSTESVTAAPSFNKQGFANYLRDNIKIKEQVDSAVWNRKQCAKWVRQALCATSGGNIAKACDPPFPFYAKEYGPYLERLGFVAVASSSDGNLPSGYSPQSGDIIVFTDGIEGHVSGYDATSGHWYSDRYHGSHQRSVGQHSPFVIYRWP